MNPYIELAVFCGSILVYAVIFGICVCVSTIYESYLRGKYQNLIPLSVPSTPIHVRYLHCLKS